MKRFIVIFFIFVFNVFAEEDLAMEYFKDLSNQYKIFPLSEQSFCYKDSEGLKGYRVQSLQRIASISKIFTTYLASENLDLHKRFRTQFLILNDSLHIKGGQDPYFEEEKLFLLFHALNEMGFKHFKKITFDSSFHFYDLPLGRYLKITPSLTRSRLKFYVDKKNLIYIKKKWNDVQKFAEEEGVKLPISLPEITADIVAFVDQDIEGEGAHSLVHESKPLYQIIKSMNVQSKNFVSENIFTMASKIQSMSNLLSNNGIGTDTYLIKNGSGLPILDTRVREDNLASCETILKLMILLEKSIQKFNLTLSEIMAINGGVDLGSFRNRFKPFPEIFNSVLAKTGTLKNSSTLAGILLAPNDIPFAVLNHTTETDSARLFQDHFVSKLFDLLGPAKPLIYKKISIFPWDETPFLIEDH